MRKLARGTGGDRLSDTLGAICRDETREEAGEELARMSLRPSAMETTKLVPFVIALAVACSHQSDRDQSTMPDKTTTEVEGPIATEEPRRVETALETSPATELDAKASFEETADGVTITLNVENAKPGMQAVHVHEIGDCSDIPGKSMGEHFAPDYQQHALPDQEARHLGDLGNIEIGQDGKGKLEILAPRASLKPNDSHSFLGKAIVVHESKDKGTQPSGDAGTPVACGVIRSE
jgi:Cu-Zn family superoxide dismutase